MHSAQVQGHSNWIYHVLYRRNTMRGSLSHRPKSPATSLAIPLHRARLIRAEHMPNSTVGNVKYARIEIHQVSALQPPVFALYVGFLARRFRHPLLRYHHIIFRAPSHHLSYPHLPTWRLHYLCLLAARSKRSHVPLAHF